MSEDFRNLRSVVIFIVPILKSYRGGVGRAGMIAACVLLRLGQARSPGAAIQEVGQLQKHNSLDI